MGKRITSLVLFIIFISITLICPIVSLAKVETEYYETPHKNHDTRDQGVIQRLFHHDLDTDKTHNLTIFTYNHCMDCNEDFKVSVTIGDFEHTWTDLTTTTKITMYKDEQYHTIKAYKDKQCSVCSRMKKRSEKDLIPSKTKDVEHKGPATGYKINDGYKRTASMHYKQTKVEHLCSTCGHTYKVLETDKGVNHSFKLVSQNTKPGGYTTYTYLCDVCGYRKTVTRNTSLMTLQ